MGVLPAKPPTVGEFVRLTDARTGAMRYVRASRIDEISEVPDVPVGTRSVSVGGTRAVVNGIAVDVLEPVLELVKAVDTATFDL